MPKLPARTILIGAGVLAALLLLGLVAWLKTGPSPTQPFFSAAPSGLTVRTLGAATNYLKFERDRHWQAFAVSNGTSKLIVFTVFEVEQRTYTGWFTNYPAAASLRTRHETSGELAPGREAVFYASMPMTSVPWRLRIGCFEATVMDELERSAGKLKAKILGKPPSNMTSWSGGRYELITEEILPEAEAHVGEQVK